MDKISTPILFRYRMVLVTMSGFNVLDSGPEYLFLSWSRIYVLSPDPNFRNTRICVGLYLNCQWRSTYQGEKILISLTGLTPPLVCVCLVRSQNLGFHCHCHWHMSWSVCDKRFVVIGSSSFCWYCWNCWPSLFKPIGYSLLIDKLYIGQWILRN